MGITEILVESKIDLEKLQKGLKHIGLNLSKFENVQEEFVPDLIDLFKIAVDIDPKSTSRNAKLDLQLKLDKVLKGKRINNPNNISANIELSETKALAKVQIKSNLQNPILNIQSHLASPNRKLGYVKFFDSTKGFGYVHSFSDNKDCFIHVSKLITSDIDKNDVVIFETVVSNKKPGELDAIKVSKNIPAFIFNKETNKDSYAYPLSPFHLEKHFFLAGKYETGFAIVNANSSSESSWKISIVDNAIIPKTESISYSKVIVHKLLSNLIRNKSTIEWLTSLLQTEFGEAEITSIFSEVTNNFEQKTIHEINNEINSIKDFSFFKIFLEEKKKTFNKISFVLWGQDLLKKLPNNDFETELELWNNEIFPNYNKIATRNIFQALLKEEGASKRVNYIFNHIKKSKFTINSKDEFDETVSFLTPLISSISIDKLDEDDFICIANHYYIKLYEIGLIKELSDERIIHFIDELKTDDEKANFIEKLPSDKILSFYFTFPSLSNYQEKYIAGILESEFSKIDFLCFDLESDGEKINKFAWKNRLGEKSESDFKKQEDGIAEMVTLINSGSLIIGQNIKEFDLSVLSNHGASPSSDVIWDTLDVEMLLNPERFSYGLKTQHSAASDTALTYRLFKNQLSRIIVSQSNLDAVKELLPSKAIEAINDISSNSNWDLLDYEYFVKQSNEFFRPNPTNQNISEQTFNQLTEKLNEEGNKVVIAPEFLWNTISHQFDLTFYSDNKSLGFCLNKEKIEATLGDDKLLKAILFRFVDSCISKGLQPYFQHLPIAIRLKLNSEQSTLICDSIDVDFGNINHKPICIKPTDIEILKQHGNQVSDLKIIVVGNELYSLTSKLQLGQDFDFATIFDRLKNEPIWLQMSGGKSFISLDQSHCRQLGITEFPEFVQNIWLEKIGKGKFKVWCNLNFEACVNSLSNDVCFIDWIDETFAKSNSYIIRPNTRKSGYIAEQNRVNPESLYRKMYWVYQFKLFEGIGNTNNPKVLIVNDELETEKLSAYARRKGYFIPDTKASLARQVELLHTHRSPNKLLIASFLTLDKIISSNYTDPLDFIWDSFLLQEKLQMLKGKLLVEFETNEEQKEDDYQADINAVQKDYDLFSLIKLHKPLIDYYYKMLYDNNPDSQLFLCDTRLSDYYSIEKSLHLNTKSVRMWFKEADYDTDKEIAAEFFSSAHENADSDFNIDEAKEILRQIFLIPEEGGNPYPWHDYQHPCLNDILPAKKDLLISLPTGAGKSILFQGPALFRSAFSSKLSIVISPLRALMHDHINGLNKKGFLSNIEYLSGDKSHQEIKDIYRRTAGGEITLLYITPERFRSKSFNNCLLTRLDADTGLEYVVFDEAHCISQWGQEFRPDYLNAGRVIADISKKYVMRKLLFSATISDQVANEIEQILPGIMPVSGMDKNYNPVRDHIKMDFKNDVIEDERLKEIATYLKVGNINPELSRAIVFVKSRKKVEECSEIFSVTLKLIFGEDCSFAEKVGGFHAGMDSNDREETYDKFKSGEIVILFSTKAFGMGMDIPNIHFVTHYSPPSTFEDFLQEVGRAGRNETLRSEAGFNNGDNPIKTLCLITKDDFRKLKDQLHESRISWQEVKEIKKVLEEYIARFKPLKPDTQLPVAVPFNLYSNVKGSVSNEFDTTFRIALHWLERLERIKLGYFTITHLEFETTSLIELAKRIDNCPNNECEKVCHAIIDLLPHNFESNKIVQLSIASLRSISRLSLENLFTALLKNHSVGILKLIQEVIIEPTQLRTDEIIYSLKPTSIFKYPALKTIFSLAKQIMNDVPDLGSVMFQGDELDNKIKECINENINNSFSQIPWPIESSTKSPLKTLSKYTEDIFKKRSKHAFTIIRLLGKTKHDSKIEKVTDGNRKISIQQSVFNGYHKKEEWFNKIEQLEKDCIKILDYVSNCFFDKNIKIFNWPDIISRLKLNGNIQYLSDLLFILSVLGYTKTGGLLPSGIEIFLHSIDNIDEKLVESNDKIIYEEFTETQEIRELKLISLQLLSTLADDKKDAFIKGFFAAKSKLELINHLQNIGDIDDEHLIFKAFRGEAIKYQELHRLNNEQREIYFSDANQNIKVVAGPGSGKTHTLTLRVARLVYYKFANPEEILVLAYNRAVVSELKERLGKLFKDLGFGNLAKRIKIFTFHGLAKKYCQEQLEGLKFEEWEPKLLQILNNTPGIIMNQLAPLKHILVDEFQDIDEVRMDLLYRFNELTNAYLFIIGDPNQSIYGYAREHMDPYYYYNDFDVKFEPTNFTLLNNHRSYPDILTLAGEILTLPEEHQHLIPIATKIPDENFILNYTEIINNVENPEIKWWDKLNELLLETVRNPNENENKPYKQIAILFRTNNEVYRGFQRIKSLGLTNVRIRIQGNLPYEFTRIRECHAVILYLKSKIGEQIPLDFRQTFRLYINNLIDQNQNWNHFYIRVIHALVLEYLEEQDDSQVFDDLLEFITELTYKDDGQLYKIYEKHLGSIATTTNETEIVLTTMHKVKGLEFDCVIIPPSISNLPLNNSAILTQEELEQQLDEEKRLAFVAYTRARYRLLIFKHFREIALANNTKFEVDEEMAKKLGYSVKPELSKLFISWAATQDKFSIELMEYLRNNIKIGDSIRLVRKFVIHNGKTIGLLSNDGFEKKPDVEKLKDFIVNEVVVWSFEETDEKFKHFWCPEAINQGYIYLVDFAGFGVPS